MMRLRSRPSACKPCWITNRCGERCAASAAVRGGGLIPSTLHSAHGIDGVRGTRVDPAGPLLRPGERVLFINGRWVKGPAIAHRATRLSARRDRILGPLWNSMFHHWARADHQKREEHTAAVYCRSNECWNSTGRVALSLQLTGRRLRSVPKATVWTVAPHPETPCTLSATRCGRGSAPPLDRDAIDPG